MQTAWRVYLTQTEGLCFQELGDFTGDMKTLKEINDIKLNVVSIFSIRHSNGEIQNIAILEPKKR